jgi:BirA family biotin operon repressor/biotin-[acetyl-CoA-carboxylase] ligase
MERIRQTLTYLREQDDYVSGDYIAERLGLSRTAVWKYMNQLDHLGYRINKLKGKGYRLVGTPDRLYPWEVARYLKTDIVGSNIVYRDEVDSTNALAFKLALAGENEGCCVIAERQEKGKGRLGRKWFSPTGKNLYLSLILKPPIHPSRVYPITFISCLAVVDTVADATGLPAELKWPNDVLIHGKKICGTLLEISTEADMVRFVVIGIGFNVNVAEADMDREIAAKATSLFMESKKMYERAPLCGMLLNNLERYYRVFMEKGEREICRIWEERAKIRGRHLEITQMGETYRGTAEGIDRDGAILLNIGGTTKKIIAGDVNF